MKFYLDFRNFSLDPVDISDIPSKSIFVPNNPNTRNPTPILIFSLDSLWFIRKWLLKSEKNESEKI